MQLQWARSGSRRSRKPRAAREQSAPQEPRTALGRPRAERTAAQGSASSSWRLTPCRVDESFYSYLACLTFSRLHLDGEDLLVCATEPVAPAVHARELIGRQVGRVKREPESARSASHLAVSPASEGLGIPSARHREGEHGTDQRCLVPPGIACRMCRRQLVVVGTQPAVARDEMLHGGVLWIVDPLTAQTAHAVSAKFNTIFVGAHSSTSPWRTRTPRGVSAYSLRFSEEMPTNWM